MSDDSSPPDFERFARWLAARPGPPGASADRQRALLDAARAARDEFANASAMAVSAPPVEKRGRQHTVEVLNLLAAASADDTARPPELTTAKGFRVTLAYDEGEGNAGPSIAVLVQSPPDLLRAVQNETAYLWSGEERFELGQFDADGKAIGVLPAGVQISVSDFKAGKIKLEEPGDPDKG